MIGLSLFVLLSLLRVPFQAFLALASVAQAPDYVKDLLIVYKPSANQIKKR